MIRTHGLTHISLDVHDPEISLKFYQAMFGVREYFRDATSIQVLGPGEQDVIAFIQSENAGKPGAFLISVFGWSPPKK